MTDRFEEAMEAAVKARFYAARMDTMTAWDDLPESTKEGIRDNARIYLDAALPLIEKRVRERVFEEIDRHCEKYYPWPDGEGPEDWPEAPYIALSAIAKLREGTK